LPGRGWPANWGPPEMAERRGEEGRWEALKEAFSNLVELAPAERDVYLRELGGRDEALEVSLRNLLEADARQGPSLGPLDPALVPPPPLDGGDGAAAQDPLGLEGRTLSHFRVLDLLGAGGMGVVYRAEDLHLGRVVALKFLREAEALDTPARTRLLEEARAASALDHPNICTIHEVGETPQGAPFLAMGCYTGETLRERLSRLGPLPVEEVLDLSTQILEGLGAAHGAGITHRDLKPANLFLATGGRVKILDFGLARRTQGDLSEAVRREGTVAYMSPEQLTGGTPDPRTDLWAFGVVLWEMLTGTPPFGSGHDLSTLYAILHEEPGESDPPPTAIPPAFLGVLSRLLQKAPSDRYGDAGEVRNVLEAAGARWRGSGGSVTSLVDGEPVRSGEPGTSEGRSLRRGLLLGLPGLGLLLALMLALGFPSGSGPGGPPGTRGSGEESGGATTPAPIRGPSIAVLPFLDLSAAGNQQYFSDGISEEILDALARAPELHVVARTSSFRFRDSSLSPTRIGEELGVSSLLQGSVRREGTALRLTVQLLDAPSGRQLWSRSYDREVGDIFRVQAEIAGTVAEALRVRLAANTPGGPGSSTGSPVAHDLYLQGLSHWNRRSPGDLETAIAYFERATREDPSFARAYAGLALAQAVLPVTFSARVTPAEVRPRVEGAAARALELDPTLAEAHAARGYLLHWLWEWDQAEAAFLRALELNPRYATAHQWYGEHLAKMGRGAEGVESMRRALALDPLNRVVQNDLGIVLYLDRRLPEAILQLESTRQLDPGFPIPHYLLYRMYLQGGRIEEAARSGRQWAELTGAADPEEVMLLARVMEEPGLEPQALEILDRWASEPVPRWQDIAFHYVLLDHPGEALTALEEGVRLRAPMMVQISASPWVDPLRSEPRFQRLLETLGLE
jgi:eukaryotic-like serine/threonine-protein kinase